MPSFTMEKLRRAKKTIYLVACLYIVVGLVVAMVAALSGDRLSAFLGFLIITGALACGAVLIVLLRFGAHLSSIGDQLSTLHQQISNIQQVQRQFNSAVADDPPQPQTLPLPDRSHRPVEESLVAATLDRSRFPRLAKIMDNEPSGQIPVADKLSRSQSPSTTRSQRDPVIEKPISMRAYTTLPRTWQTAHREGDIAACRAMLSTYVDTADADAIDVMTLQLEQLIDQAAAHLRQSFAGHIHREDYEGALAVGHRIVELMPEHDIAEDFEQIKPFLFERVKKIAQATATV